MNLSALSLCIAGLSIPLMAQVPDDLDKELAALLNTPVQGASKRVQRLMDSPQAIEVLTGEEIRKMGVYRLADALKLMTSVDVLEMDTQATYVTLRGAMQQGTPRTVQFLIDGVPLFNGETGSVDVDNIPVPVDLIDKVEVVRGPSSSMYGANAVVGVIAITTKRPTTDTTGGLRISRASKNTTRGAADMATTVGKLGLTAGYSGASLGEDQVSGKNLSSGGTMNLDQNSAHQHAAFARGQYAFSSDSQVWASAGEATKTYGLSSEGSTPYQKATTQTLQAGWGQTWSPNFRTEARMSHLVQKMAMGASPQLFAMFQDPGLLGNYTYLDYSSNLMEIQGNWDPSNVIHLVGGFDRRTSTAGKVGFIGLIDSKDVTASGGFLNLDWNLRPDLALSLGARAENGTLGGSTVAPRAALVWSLNPSSSLRMGYYSSSRSPQINEKYNNLTGTLPAGVMLRFTPNQQLESEKVSSVEVGYRTQIANVTLDVTAFKMKMSQLIDQKTTVGLDPALPLAPQVITEQYINNGSSQDQGLEVAAKWLLRSNLTLGGNFTWLDYTQDTTGGRIDYAPNLKVNLWTRYSHGPLSVFLAFQHVDAVKVSVLGSPEHDRPAINELHANLGWDLGHGLTLGAYAQNLNKALTPGGATGPMMSFVMQGARREIGGTVAYRF